MGRSLTWLPPLCTRGSASWGRTSPSCWRGWSEPTTLFDRDALVGYEIVLADGTTVTRPGAKGTTARVLYAMRWRT